MFSLADLGEIAVAWARSFNPTQEQQDLAKSRLKICGTCEFRVLGITNIYKCGACGCPLHSKVFATPGPNACPKRKWPR